MTRTKISLKLVFLSFAVFSLSLLLMVCNTSCIGGGGGTTATTPASSKNDPKTAENFKKIAAEVGWNEGSLYQTHPYLRCLYEDVACTSNVAVNEPIDKSKQGSKHSIVCAYCMEFDDAFNAKKVVEDFRNGEEIYVNTKNNKKVAENSKLKSYNRVTKEEFNDDYSLVCISNDGFYGESAGTYIYAEKNIIYIIEFSESRDSQDQLISALGLPKWE